MSLVAYDDSDESGIESENEDAPVTTSTVKKTPAIISESQKEKDDTDQTGVVTTGVKEVKKDDTDQTGVVKTGEKEGKLASTPKPSAHPSMTALPSSHTTSINFDMKILDKNRSQPIRITIPSLKDFQEEEEPKKPKPRPSTIGSSLFSMLPAPKNVTSSASKVLMPQSVSKPKPKPPVKRQKKSAAAANKHQGDEEEDSSSEPLTSFFFSGADDEPLPPPIDIETPDMVGDSAASSSSSVGEPLSQHDQVTTSTPEMMSSSHFAKVGPCEAPTAGNSSYSADEDQSLLNVDALRKLCGSRDRKKGPDLSDIIDVSGSTLVGDTSMILAKELTKEQPTHSFKRKSECSSLQRRKHQITYLAEQAKAQELELRNNWAQNRITRKQTQAKYGF